MQNVASCDLLDFIDVDEQGGVKVDLKLAKRLGLGHLIKQLQINKDGIQDIELEAKLPTRVKLGEYYNLWNREAPPEVRGREKGAGEGKRGVTDIDRLRGKGVSGTCT